jgi:hypothetical protein
LGFATQLENFNSRPAKLQGEGLHQNSNQSKQSGSKTVYVNPDYKGHSQKVVDAVNKQSQAEYQKQEEEYDKMVQENDMQCLMEGRKPWE